MSYSVTSAQYFTFNAHNSVFITGETGSGKSYLVEELIKRYARGKTSDEILFAFFDFKQVEFTYRANYPEKDLNISEKLYCPVVLTPEEALDKLDELAELSKERAEKGITKPQIFIAIDECDAAVTDSNRFSKALITINQNAKKANIKITYDTSRPSPIDVIPRPLLESFDLILVGKLASKVDMEYLGVPFHSNTERFGFIVKERNNTNQ